jgi:hypothetical protein
MRLTLIALVAVALAGCGSGDDGPTISDPPPPDTDLISFTRSGGIAFTVQEIVVDYDGSATLTNVENGEPKTEDIELTEEEAETVTDAVESVDASELPEPGEGICADCYTYTFVFPDGTERAYAQSPQPPAELDPLLDEMLTILEAHSPPNQTGG